MNPTFQNRHTGELFQKRWTNATHVGLVSLTDQREVKVKRTNFVKSYGQANDYAWSRHPVPPKPNPPEPIGEPLPPDPTPLAEAELPGPRPAPRPRITGALGWTDSATYTSSSGIGADPLILTALPPKPEPDERFWNWPTIAAVVLAALFVVGMWIAVLS